MRVRSTLFAFALAFSAAVPASGTDLRTVNVPVEFKNLNAAVIGVRVTCKLAGKDPVTLAPRDVGRVDKTLTLSGGNYMGPSPVTIVFNPSTTLDLDLLNTTTGGSCEFALLFLTGAGSSVGTYVPAAGDTQQPLFAQQPGAPFRQKVTFTFP